MNILIYTPVAFEISETFIYNQYKFQNKHNLTGVCGKLKENSESINTKFYVISNTPLNLTDRIISFIVVKLKKLYKYSFSFFNEKKFIQIIKKNNIDLIHCNYGTSGLKIMNLAKKNNIPLIVHFHGFDASVSLKDPYYVKFLPKLFKISAKIIAVSNDMKERLLPYTEKDKIVVIPYGSNFNKINFNNKKYNNDIIRILHVGRLTPKKGVFDLVNVFNKIIKTKQYKIKLDIIGNGEELLQIKNYIAKNKLSEFVVLHNSLPHENVISFMKTSDIFVLNSRVAPSGDKEGFPNVIIEAMACESAIVSTYHAGIPMAVTNEKEGLLVEEKNNNELEKALVRLIVNNEERKKFAENAKEKALKKFSVEKMIEEYNRIYESVK